METKDYQNATERLNAFVSWSREFRWSHGFFYGFESVVWATRFIDPYKPIDYTAAEPKHITKLPNGC